jgi:predicted site-specific integrase-resolvase
MNGYAQKRICTLDQKEDSFHQVMQRQWNMIKVIKIVFNIGQEMDIH